MSNRPEESSDSREQTQKAANNNNVGRDLTIGGSINQIINNIKFIFNGEQEERKLRHILLEDVLKKELDNTFKDSFYKGEPINLEKERQFRPVDSRRAKEAPIPLGESQLLPPGTKMIDIFDEASKKLLILGKPGAGKTIAVKELAWELIARAENTINDPDVPNEPIPILLDLVSWKTSQPIKDWIVEQLKDKGVNRKLSRKWFKRKELLPLLDGLDRLSTDDQRECIKAINELLQEDYQPRGLVVCSRLEEYEVHSRPPNGKKKVRLKLEDAICLKPLTEDYQLRDYFESIGLRQLWQSIQEDSNLLEIFKTPLFLGVLVLTLVSDKVSPERQQQILQKLTRCESETERRDCLMEIFVEQMLDEDNEIDSHYYTKDKQPSKNDTEYWLNELAKIMEKQSLEYFLIENMQPSLWLDEAKERETYSLIVRLVVGLTAGFTAGLYLGGWTHQLVVLFFAILSGVVTGAISDLFTKLVASFPKLVSQLSSKILPGLMFFVLMYSLSSLISINLNLKDWNSLVLLTGIGVGLVFYGLSPLQIKAADKLEFSPNRAIQCIGLALLLGVLFVPIHFLMDSELYTENRAYALYELFSFFLMGLVAGLIPGQEAKIELKLNPNQGIWRTLRYSVMWFVICGLISGLFTVVVDGPEIIRATGISLTVGLLAGLIGSRNSGLVCIRYFILRVTLYSKKSIPCKYADFLGYATERKLLQKVGGRYKFWLPLLQEHFANKTSECSTEEKY